MISSARMTAGYAELVRQVAPSVVTVLVEEKREGAAQRAVERAAARSSERDGLNELIRRLLAGPGDTTVDNLGPLWDGWGGYGGRGRWRGDWGYWGAGRSLSRTTPARC